MLDLSHADRQDLLAIIGQQQDRIADVERQLAHQGAPLAAVQAALTQVTTQLGAQTVRDDAEPDAPQGMPGHKPTQAPVRSPRPRKRRRHQGRHRRVATLVEVHALAQCSHCQAPLSGGTPKRSRQVIELPTAPVVMTEHVSLERRCPDCGRRLTPPPALTGMVCGQSRLGIGLVSLIAVLREAARVPFGTIPRLLQTLTGLHLRVGAIVDTGGRVVHAEETGWRQAGLPRDPGHHPYTVCQSLDSNRLRCTPRQHYRVLDTLPAMSQKRGLLRRSSPNQECLGVMPG